MVMTHFFLGQQGEFNYWEAGKIDNILWWIGHLTKSQLDTSFPFWQKSRFLKLLSMVASVDPWGSGNHQVSSSVCLHVIFLQKMSKSLVKFSKSPWRKSSPFSGSQSLHILDLSALLFPLRRISQRAVSWSLSRGHTSLHTHKAAEV